MVATDQVRESPMSVECAHCGRQQPRGPEIYWSVGTGLYLCHPADRMAMDCCALVTIHNEPLGARRPGREFHDKPYPRFFDWEPTPPDLSPPDGVFKL